MMTPRKYDKQNTADYKLVFLPPPSGEDFFDYFVTPRLEAFARRFPTKIDIGYVRAGYMVGDIWSAAVFTGNKAVATVLLSPQQSLYNNAPILHVLFAHVDPGLNLAMWLNEQVEQFARDNGFHTLSAQSPRKGWFPIAQATGWHPEAFLWSKEL